MKTRKAKKRPIPRVRLRPRRSDDEVGYGRPPPEHRFRPGQSGNPKGRPRGANSEATILQQLLQRKIVVHQNGRARKITVLEAILLRFTEDSLKGNTKSAAFLLNRHAGSTRDMPQVNEELSQDDHEILEAFARRIQQSER